MKGTGKASQFLLVVTAIMFLHPLWAELPQRESTPAAPLTHTSALENLVKKIDLSAPVKNRNRYFNYAMKIVGPELQKLRDELNPQSPDIALVAQPLARLNNTINEKLTTEEFIYNEDVPAFLTAFQELRKETESLLFSSPNLKRLISEEIPDLFTDLLDNNAIPSKGWRRAIWSGLVAAKNSAYAAKDYAMRHKWEALKATASAIVAAGTWYMTTRLNLAQRAQEYRNNSLQMKHLIKEDFKVARGLATGEINPIEEYKKFMGENPELKKAKFFDEGNQNVIGQLKKYVEWIKKGNFNLLPKGMLFYGPPGTGKTTTAAALANASGINFEAYSGPDITNQWYLKHVFDTARGRAPAILIIDEIEKMPEAQQKQILAHIEGIGPSDKNPIVVIGTSNSYELSKDEQTNKALLSRLSVHFKFEEPSVPERAKILSDDFKKMANEKGLTFDENELNTEFWKKIAAATKDLTIRQLPNINKTAIGNALDAYNLARTVTRKHILDGLQTLVGKEAMKEIPAEWLAQPQAEPRREQPSENAGDEPNLQ